MKYNQDLSSSTFLDVFFLFFSFSELGAVHCESVSSVKDLCDAALELNQTWSFLKFRVPLYNAELFCAFWPIHSIHM